MSSSLSVTEETCVYSGGTSDNGIRRGRGIVWKWMDGRIVKDEPVRRGTRSVMPQVLCTTETSDEGLGPIWLYMRGESSHGGRAVGGEGRSQGARDEGREADSLESGQVRSRVGSGPIGGQENPLADV